MDMGLAGRRVLVTGGSKGLGFAAAREFLAEGARVVFCARDAHEVAAAEAELGDGARGVVADVTDPEQVARLIDAAVAELGGIDVVVNNAGGANPGTGESISEDALRHDYDLKVLTWQRVLRAALPQLRASDQPRVVNVGSVYAAHPDHRFFATAVNRAAGANLTRCWAVELGREGILVNGVDIGCIETPQWANIRDKRAPGTPLEEFLAATAEEDVPLGRIGRPEEAAAAIVFLASARASYLTGTTIDVAGGMGLRV